MASISQRTVICFLCFLGYACLYMFKIIPITFVNDYNISIPRSWLVKITTVLYLILSTIGGIIATRYGGATMFGGALMVSSVLVLFSGLIYSTNIAWWMAGQLVDVFSQSIAFCAVLDVWARWATTNERSTRVAFSYAGYFLPQLLFGILQNINMLELVYSYYFLFGFFSLGCGIWWLRRVTNDPDQNQFISESEKRFLVQTIEISDKERHRVGTYPWKSIIFSKPLFVTCIVNFILQFTNTTAPYLYYGRPNFMHDLSPTVRKILLCLITSIPLLFIPLFGYLADLMKRARNSSTKIHKYYICSGLLILMIAHILYGSFSMLDRNLMIVTSNISKALTDVTLLVNLIGLSPKYVGILVGIYQTFWVLAELSASIALQILMNDDSIQTILKLHQVIALLCTFAAFLYVKWGSSELQSWNGTPIENHELKISPNNETEK